MGAWKALQKLGRRRPLKRPRLGSQQRPLNRQELQRENNQLREEIERLRQKVTESEKQVADCEEQIADLERQLAGRGALWAKDSTNSSKPPSSDGPAAAR